MSGFSFTSLNNRPPVVSHWVRKAGNAWRDFAHLLNMENQCLVIHTEDISQNRIERMTICTSTAVANIAAREAILYDERQGKLQFLIIRYRSGTVMVTLHEAGLDSVLTMDAEEYPSVAHLWCR